MSSSAGESGDSMLHHFRIANGLDSKRYNDLFVTRSELFRQPMLPEGDPHRLGQNDVVILLDEVSGTGKQVCDAWNDPVTSFGALLAGVGKVYLVLVAASRTARQRITDETTLCPLRPMSCGQPTACSLTTACTSQRRIVLIASLLSARGQTQPDGVR